MPLDEVAGDGWDAPLLEGLLWGLLLLGAALCTRRAPPGQRPGWWLIAAGLGLIVADKAFDVHAVLHAVGTGIATAVDAEHQLRGPNAPYRDAALALGFALSLGAVAWWLRRDEHIGRAKLSCLAGLALVGALLAMRLMPELERYLPDWITKGIELMAWALVAAGLWQGRVRATTAAKERLVDGFL